jgi:hypothetical protein
MAQFFTTLLAHLWRSLGLANSLHGFRQRCAVWLWSCSLCFGVEASAGPRLSVFQYCYFSVLRSCILADSCGKIPSIRSGSVARSLVFSPIIGGESHGTQLQAQHFLQCSFATKKILTFIFLFV